MSTHGLTLIAPLPRDTSVEDGQDKPVQTDKQIAPISKLDALIGQSKRRTPSARLSLASDDTSTTEATETSSRGDDAVTLFTYDNETYATTTTHATLDENDGTLSFFLSDLRHMFSEPFSDIKQGYDDGDEQTIESDEEDLDEDEDQDEYSLNFQALPIKSERSDPSKISARLARIRSNTPTDSSRVEQKTPECIEQEMPKRIESDAHVKHIEKQGDESNSQTTEGIGKKQGARHGKDVNLDDDDYSLNFNTIPVKPKRSDLSAIIAKLDRKRSKETAQELDRRVDEPACTAADVVAPRDTTPTEDKPDDIERGEKVDLDKHLENGTESDDQRVEETRPPPPLIAENTKRGDSPSVSITVEDLSEVSDEIECNRSPTTQAEYINASKKGNSVAEKEDTILPKTGAPKSDSSQDFETSSDNSPPIDAEADYQGFACFALLGLCVATRDQKEGTFQCAPPIVCGMPSSAAEPMDVARIMDEDDKDIEIPSIECILEEASGTRLCMPRKRALIKIKVCKGSAANSRTGLVRILLKLTQKKKSSSVPV